MMSKRILITGGSGFIGTNLVQHLLEEGCEVLNVDIVSPKIEQQSKCWKQVDICNLEQLQEAVNTFQPDFLINLAARTDLNGKTLADYDAEVGGVDNVLDAIEQVDSVKRAIFASSMYVCEPGYKPKNFDDYAPHTIYGEAKVLTEKKVKQRNPQYTWSIIRPTSIWGPWFGEPYNNFFQIVRKHLYFHMGERACNKTYGYVDNTVYQIMSILHADDEKVNHRVFYLGDYEPYNISEWANEVAHEFGVRIPRIPYFLFVIAAKFGDLLKKVGVTFPMTSFRLHNMTTDNVHDLKPIQAIAPNLPVGRKEGTRRTVEWMKSQS